MSYLALSVGDLNAGLVGLERVLVFNAWDVDVLVNKARSDGATTVAKLDWARFAVTDGLALPGLQRRAAPAAWIWTTWMERAAARRSNVLGFVVGTADFEFTMATADVVTGNAALGTLANASLTVDLAEQHQLLRGHRRHRSTTTSHAGQLRRRCVEHGRCAGLQHHRRQRQHRDRQARPACRSATRRATSVSRSASTGAQLVGVDGLTFIANGSVLINKATNAAGLDSPQRINWFAATNSTNDPANLIPAFSASLTDAVALQINGSAALDVFGAVLGTATFSITQGTQTIDTKNTAIGAAGVLTNASVMVISLSNLNLFAGIGGKLNQNPVTNLATIGIDTTGALGFSITGGSVNMAIVRPAGLAARRQDQLPRPGSLARGRIAHRHRRAEVQRRAARCR